jgi:hypothetical protein
VTTVGRMSWKERTSISARCERPCLDSRLWNLALGFPSLGVEPQLPIDEMRPTPPPTSKDPGHGAYSEISQGSGGEADRDDTKGPVRKAAPL